MHGYRQDPCSIRQFPKDQNKTPYAMVSVMMMLTRAKGDTASRQNCSVLQVHSWVFHRVKSDAP
jgi:hypothetical protein